MNWMKDLTILIQEDIAAGMEWGAIARRHGVSLNWVAEAAYMMDAELIADADTETAL